MDKARLRQLINQSPDQLTNTVAESGYQNEINLYASRYTGGDLVEAALTHNLENELDNMLSHCRGKVRKVVEIYSSRYEYQNAKAVLRAVANGIEAEKLSKDILPDLNEINTPWIKILESSDDLRSAAQQMRRKSFGYSANSTCPKMLDFRSLRRRTRSPLLRCLTESTRIQRK
jgi:vacuolar-type H+-ATPase subunit C/Vma6